MEEPEEQKPGELQVAYELFVVMLHAASVDVFTIVWPEHEYKSDGVQATESVPAGDEPGAVHVTVGPGTFGT